MKLKKLQIMLKNKKKSKIIIKISKFINIYIQIDCNNAIRKLIKLMYLQVNLKF